MSSLQNNSPVDLSIIVLNWNTKDLLHQCLRSVLEDRRGLSWEILVVDNASTDGSAPMVKHDFPSVRIIQNTENLGFAHGNNQGIVASEGRHVLLLNSDTIVLHGALERLVAFMDQHPNVGACSPRLLCPDDTPQPYAFGQDPTLPYLVSRGLNQLVFHRYLHDWGTSESQEVDWVSGACCMVRQEAIAQAGLLDERFFMYFEDSDWCLRIRRAGWKIYYHPQAEIIHLGGQSLKQNPRARKAYYSSLRHFYGKHYSPMARALLEVFLVPYRWLAG